MRYDEPRLVWTGVPITHFGTREEPSNLTQGAPVFPGYYYSAYYKAVRVYYCHYKAVRVGLGARVGLGCHRQTDRHKTDTKQT